MRDDQHYLDIERTTAQLYNTYLTPAFTYPDTEPITTAPVNPYENNQDALIALLQEVKIPIKMKKTADPRLIHCSLCNSSCLKANTRTLHTGRVLCETCVHTYTKVCAGTCQKLLVNASFRTPTDDRYTAIRFKSPDAGALTFGDIFGEKWFCLDCAPDTWTCSTCRGFYHVSVEKAINEPRYKCNHCYSAFIAKINKELPYNANVLDYLKPYPKASGSELQYGIELEVQYHDSVSGKNNKKLELVRKLLPDFVICKFDRSITKREDSYVYGFEIVSVPATMEDHKKQWPKLLREKHGLFSWKYGDCGMHVHISRKALTPLQIARMLKFINSPANAELISDVAGRFSSEFSKILDKKLTDAHYVYRDGTHLRHDRTTTDHDKRYEALNLTNANTVELRIFKGNLKEESFMKNLEFTDALVHYCRDCSITLLKTTPFVEYVKSKQMLYPNLVAFLKKKDYITKDNRPSQKAEKLASAELLLTEKAKTDVKYVGYLAAFKQAREKDKEAVFDNL